MDKTKFSMNAFLIIVLVVSAIYFFFSIMLYDMAGRFAVNDSYPIEGTDLIVRYSNLEPNGIYRGRYNPGTLVAKGDFGHDWGVVLEGDSLYINEYNASQLGLTFSSLVKIDLADAEKSVILEDAVLRGRCASGEMVVLKGFLMPSVFPKSNALCSFYSIASDEISAGNSTEVLYMDPESGKVTGSVMAEDPLSEDFDSEYLQKTSEEVKG